ncbi:hypothetical protein [uncultured Algibacter sp.]|uniref:hypothetical protein n=1 Tax=uncultured Algibacter sp. TaxID=298659 RepID=UPI00260DD316|nr:hypothetical protein [uncultured Algibacter sp.]
MKNFLLIILISISTSSFSQVKIDTSEIKSIRYEWKLNKEKNDSTLNQILTEYKSGIYKEEFPSFKKEHHEYPFINIFESKTNYLNRKVKQTLKVHYYSALGGESKFYYDKYGNLDSIYQNYYKDSLKEWKYNIKKEYRRKGKLKYLINKFDEKEVYHYNFFGNLKKIELYKDSVLYEISNYKKGLLISKVYPTRKKYRKKFTYEYDKKGRIIKRDDNDYDLYLYEYNKFGLSKIEKIFKSKNMVVEYTLFIYDKNGILKRKKEFARNDKLREEFVYEYK